MTADVDYYRDLLRPVFENQRFLVAGDVMASILRLAKQIGDLGAERPFLLAAAPGVGEQPSEEEAVSRLLPVTGGHIIECLRRFEPLLAKLPEEIQEAVERWDPERRARSLFWFTFTDVPQVGGRPRYAYRPPAWAAIEDKTECPRFFDAIGLRRGPLAVVAADSAVMSAAARRLDAGSGTVWAGDASEGLNGGGLYVRWVRDPQTEAQACEFFEAHCARVRVMPFVEGIPCSLHGIVFPSGTSVFRPVEMIVLRGSDARLRYVGTSSFWDPPAAERERMRDLVRRVGEGLRQQVGFRGAYTVDGVLGEHGFVPTEINARIGGAVNDLYGTNPELPLHALALAATEGEDLDYRPEELERLVLDGADAKRAGSVRTVVSRKIEDGEAHHLVRHGKGFRDAADGETPDGVLAAGSNPAGGFLFYRPDPSRFEVGASMAPEAVAALAAADRWYETGFGELSAPLDVSKDQA